jgi:lysine 2,3-aminomutase
MLVSKVTPHLRKLAKSHEAIKRQFFDSPIKSKYICPTFDDPLEEDKYEVTKGLIHKYPGRVLALLTMTCAAYCRFCTRQRMVSDIRKGITNHKDIDAMIEYVKAHPDVKEVIFSGGDPLVVPKTLFYALEQFSKLPQIKIIRIGTRMPVSDPLNVPIDELVKIIENIKQPVYVLIHFEHPAEITPETEKVVYALRKAGCFLCSQTVFLKDVNDDYNTLYELFNRLLEIGVVPYYIYRCDLVRGAEHFICDFEKEIEIMTELRKNLSGLAYPTYVIDTPQGSGKIPVPLNFWKFKKNKYKDFNGTVHPVI